MYKMISCLMLIIKKKKKYSIHIVVQTMIFLIIYISTIKNDSININDSTYI